MLEPNGKGLRRDQRVLLALAALFVVPLLVAWLWFFNVEVFPPEGSIAKGQLVEPVRPLGTYSLPRVDGEGSVTDQSLHGRWALVYVGGARCDERCRETLYEMRQVHVALGRDAVRLQRVYLLVDAMAPEDAAYFTQEQEGLFLATIAQDDPLLQSFTLDGVPIAEAGRIFLVDPFGNLMMRYEPEAAGRDLFDDLKRLFRVSRIG